MEADVDCFYVLFVVKIPGWHNEFNKNGGDGKLKILVKKDYIFSEMEYFWERDQNLSDGGFVKIC